MIHPMKISIAHLRRIIKEEVTKVVSEGLAAGDRVDSPEKFGSLQPGDSIKINGKDCTVVSMDRLTAHLTYVLVGSSVRKSLDYRYAYAEDESETPEIEIEWMGVGTVPAKTRRAPKKRSPLPYYD